MDKAKESVITQLESALPSCFDLTQLDLQRDLWASGHTAEGQTLWSIRIPVRSTSWHTAIEQLATGMGLTSWNKATNQPYEGGVRFKLEPVEPHPSVVRAYLLFFKATYTTESGQLRRLDGRDGARFINGMLTAAIRTFAGNPNGIDKLLLRATEFYRIVHMPWPSTFGIIYTDYASPEVWLNVERLRCTEGDRIMELELPQQKQTAMRLALVSSLLPLVELATDCNLQRALLGLAMEKAERHLQLFRRRYPTLTSTAGKLVPTTIQLRNQRGTATGKDGVARSTDPGQYLMLPSGSPISSVPLRELQALQRSRPGLRVCILPASAATQKWMLYAVAAEPRLAIGIQGHLIRFGLHRSLSQTAPATFANRLDAIRLILGVQDPPRMGPALVHRYHLKNWVTSSFT